MIDEAARGRAREAAAKIAPLGAEIERARRMSEGAVAAMVEAGVFKLVVPAEYGGGAANAETLLAVIETIAAADGSAGWCAMIGATSGLMCGYLDDPTAREVFGPNDAITCGVFAPMGRATRSAEGFRVSGRWPFASGCEHAAWRMGGAIVEGDPLLPNGAPDVRSMIFRSSDTRVIETWDTMGLRGTGSHDIEVKDATVPFFRCFSLISERPREKRGIYMLPFFGILAAGVAAAALGIARGALDAWIDIASKKIPPGGKRTLAHREGTQLDVARAEGKIRAARAFLFESMAAAEEEAHANGEASTKARALVRLAASHGAHEAVAATGIAFESSGASALYAKGPIERKFRDVHAAAQHLMVNQTSTTLAGRVLLGVETDASTL